LFVYLNIYLATPPVSVSQAVLNTVTIIASVNNYLFSNAVGVGISGRP